MIDRKLKGEALIGKKCKPVRSLIKPHFSTIAPT
nr:MAG TPA: hypothetical protein [Caudoviricetes sp.]